MAIKQFEHHGKKMWVEESLFGKHREHCLCFKCKKLNIEDREANCKIANLLYRTDIMCGITTPVFECVEFEARTT